MREKCQNIVRVALHLPREARKEMVADFHPTARRIGRRLVDDHADATEIDVAVVGDDFERGRRGVYRDVLFEHGLVAAPQRGIACGDAKHGGPFLQAGHFCQVHPELLLAHRLSELLRSETVLCSALGERRRDRFQARPLVCDLDLERCQTHHAHIGRDHDPRRLRFETRPDQETTADQRGDKNQNRDGNEECFGAASIGRKSVHASFSKGWR